MEEMWIDGKPFVPKISTGVVVERIKKFEPILYNKEWNCLQRIEIPAIQGVAYTWDPKFVGDPLRFKIRETIFTDHYCGYHAFFKPSLYEVLAQIPENCDSEVNAFWIDTRQDIQIYKNGDGHRAMTYLGTIK